MNRNLIVNYLDDFKDILTENNITEGELIALIGRYLLNMQHPPTNDE